MGAMIPYPEGNDKIMQLILDAWSNDDWINMGDKTEANLYLKANMAVQVLAMVGLKAESLGVELFQVRHRDLVNLIWTAASTLHLATELGNDRKALLVTSKYMKQKSSGRDVRNLGMTCGEFGASIFMAIFTGRKVGPGQVGPVAKGGTSRHKIKKGQDMGLAFLEVSAKRGEKTSTLLEKSAVSLSEQVKEMGIPSDADPVEFLGRLPPHWHRANKGKLRVSKMNVWDPSKPQGQNWLEWPGKKIIKWFTANPPQMGRFLHVASSLGPPGPHAVVFAPAVLNTLYLQTKIREIEERRHAQDPGRGTKQNGRLRSILQQTWHSIFSQSQRERDEASKKKCGNSCPVINKKELRRKLYVQGMDRREVARQYVAGHTHDESGEEQNPDSASVKHKKHAKQQDHQDGEGTNHDDDDQRSGEK